MPAPMMPPTTTIAVSKAFSSRRKDKGSHLVGGRNAPAEGRGGWCWFARSDRLPRRSPVHPRLYAI